MGTNASAFLVNNNLTETDEEFLYALGFSTVEQVSDPKAADFGFIRYRDSFILFTYGTYESAVNGAVERGDDPLSSVLCQVFPESEVLAIVLQSSTDLAGFALFSEGENVRRWCVAGGHGKIVDIGKALPAEEAAAREGLTGEEVVHAVATSVLGFDLLEVFDARNSSKIEERLFRARADA